MLGADRSQSSDELSPGMLAGDYEILETIASGGCGRVYSAEHRVLQRRAAVKVLNRHMAKSPEAVHRFTREARTVNLIKHPNIVDVYDFGALPDGRPYYVMEFLDGIDLDAYLRGKGKLTPAEALALLEPVCLALSAAHQAGVIHRDVKASNIFVARAGLPWRVKLLDFGVAKLLNPWEPELTTVDHRLGTPVAMAPEQINNGRVDARTDVYGMGVLLFYLLTGEYPFQGGTNTLEHMHATAVPPAPRALVAVSAELDALVLRCLDKDQDRRFPSIEAFLDAFRAAARSSLGEHTRPPRRKLVWAAAFAVTLLGASLAARLVLSEPEMRKASAASQPARESTAAQPEPPTQPEPAAQPEPVGAQADPAPTAHEEASAPPLRNEAPTPPVAKTKKPRLVSTPKINRTANTSMSDNPKPADAKPAHNKPSAQSDAWGSNSPFLPVRPQQP